MKPNKRMIIMRGISGSGKTTRAKQIMNELEAGTSVKRFSADMYWDHFTDGRFILSRIGEAHAWCQQMVLMAANLDTDVIIVDNTHTRTWEYKTCVTIAECFGYTVEFEELPARDMIMVLTFAYRNVHNVPVSKVVEMWERWEDREDVEGEG